MRVHSIELRHVAVPLKKPIQHASHTREVSDNLIVRVNLADGSSGHGEGVPRSYVTGETIASTFECLRSIDVARHMRDPADFPAVVGRLQSLVPPSIAEDPRGMRGNAARCALELALLDAYGRHFGRPAGEAMSVAAQAVPDLVWDRPRRVRYSGAITAQSPRGERISAWKMRVYGFNQVKIKVGVEGQDDAARLRVLRRILGRRMDVRLDANEAWSAATLLERIRPLLECLPSALEQPVPHAEVEALGELRRRIVVPIMLDESLCGYPDGKRAVELGLCDLFNIRLSKCGGMLASLGLARLARQSGIGVQLGCHPGETGLLSAAGRQFASRLPHIRYLEGSYDRHVLRANVIRQDITFGYGGRAGPINGPGLGVDVDPDALEALCVERECINYD